MVDKFQVGGTYDVKSPKGFRQVKVIRRTKHDLWLKSLLTGSEFGVFILLDDDGNEFCDISGKLTSRKCYEDARYTFTTPTGVAPKLKDFPYFWTSRIP